MKFLERNVRTTECDIILNYILNAKIRYVDILLLLSWCPCPSISHSLSKIIIKTEPEEKGNGDKISVYVQLIPLHFVIDKNLFESMQYYDPLAKRAAFIANNFGYKFYITIYEVSQYINIFELALKNL